MTPKETTFWGEPAIALHSDDIEVVVLPRRGAKIASLRHASSGREWLEQPAGELGPPPGYGSAFTDAGMFGWDEMLPTITGSAYPDGEYQGAPLPDHGEVWRLPWKTRVAGEAFVWSTSGRVLPYEVTRTMRTVGARLQLEYELAATGTTPLWLLWAAHPQFAVGGRHTRIVLPAEVRHVLDVWWSMRTAHGSDSIGTQTWFPTSASGLTTVPMRAIRSSPWSLPRVTTTIWRWPSGISACPRSIQEGRCAGLSW